MNNLAQKESNIHGGGGGGGGRGGRDMNVLGLLTPAVWPPKTHFIKRVK